MKIRTGFVSNSSSSSFIVYYKDYLESIGKKKAQPGLSKTKVKLLEDFGFWKTHVHYPDQIDFEEQRRRGLRPIEESIKEVEEGGIKPSKEFIETYNDYYHYAYDVACNEWEVLEFLVKNHISFKSLCHYEHYYIEYDGKQTVRVARNYGKEMMMYGKMAREEWNEFPEEKVPHWEVDANKFLERGHYHYED